MKNKAMDTNTKCKVCGHRYGMHSIGGHCPISGMEDCGENYYADTLFAPVEDKVHDALSVMVLTPHIRKYLEEHDPKALEQALKALNAD